MVKDVFTFYHNIIHFIGKNSKPFSFSSQGVWGPRVSVDFLTHMQNILFRKIVSNRLFFCVFFRVLLDHVAHLELR